MNLLAGTDEGVYRTPLDDGDGPDRVLEGGRVLRVRRFGTRTYAATKRGLYRSPDDGASWERLETPRPEVYSVLEHPVGERLYAGTHPAHVYVSTDGGASWAEREGFQELPSRASWHTPRHRDEAHVRSLGAAGPDRVVAGVEVGGVHLSDDGGETWTERREGLHDDVHHVLVRGPDHWVASTGGGLYRTWDAGSTWTRHGEGLGHTYFREAFAHRGRLYAAATAGPPPTWNGGADTDAALFESGDEGDTFEQRDYPGGPGEFVLSWAAAAGADGGSADGGSDPVAGGGGAAVYAGTTAGSILRRTGAGWARFGAVPSSVGSLCVIP